jgi:hypothetical protein
VKSASKIIPLFISIFFLSVLLIPTDLNSFEKTGGFYHLTPRPDDKGSYLHTNGVFTFTAQDSIKNLPIRHTYFWTNINGAYEFVPNYWISGLAKIQKTSMSDRLFASGHSFRLNIFPQISFNGNWNSMLFIPPSESNSKSIRWQAGTLPNFYHGNGLFYNEFTGLGFHFDGEFQFLKIELNAVGSGYYSGDDVQSLYIIPIQEFGIGFLHEMKSFYGNRIIPGFAGDINLLKNFMLYWEGGWSIVYHQQLVTENLTKEEKKEFKYYYPEYKKIDTKKFSKPTSLNDKNIAGIIGTEWIWDWRALYIENFKWVGEIRYYGRDNVEFYTLQRKYWFDYYVDINSDQKYNNQPFNFYLLPGDCIGAYFRQELLGHPISIFYVRLRNEILFVSNLKKQGKKRKSGNDLVSIDFFLKPVKNLELGIRFSNVLLGYIEVVGGPKRNSFLLEGSRSILIDFYLYYNF